MFKPVTDVNGSNFIISGQSGAGGGGGSAKASFHFTEKISIVTGNTECCVLMCITTNLLR